MTANSEYPDSACRWCGRPVILVRGLPIQDLDRECLTCRGLNKIVCEQVREIVRDELAKERTELSALIKSELYAQGG